MGTLQEQRPGLSRRELIKRGLRTGAYAAPVVLASVIVAPVAAQTVSRPATVAPIPGTPTLTANAGTTPQSATMNTAFVTPLSVTVRDASGNPVSGAVVTFTITTAGAGGTFAGGATTVTATTNTGGVATAPTLTANGTTGSFIVTATTPSVATPAVFTLTVTPITLTANAGTTPQSATVNTAFGTPLSVTVRDSNGNLLSGVVVTFTIAAAGASGTFAGGATTVTATSNAGIATAPALTANGTIGTFTVTATAPGAAMPVTFTLTNTPAVTQPVPFFQDFILGGGINGDGTTGQLAPNTPFNVFFRPSNTNTFTPAGMVTTDAFGIGFVPPIPITNLDATMVPFIQLVATVPGQLPSITPANNAVSFTSTIISLFAVPTGSPRPAASLLGLVIQEQTTAPVGGVANITDIVDVGIFNSSAVNTAFDIYIQPNGTGAFTRVTTATTNAQGNVTAVVPITLTGTTLATTFVLNVVPTGAAPTAAVLTTTLTTPATVRTLPFTSRLAAIARTATDVPGSGLQP